MTEDASILLAIELTKKFANSTNLIVAEDIMNSILRAYPEYTDILEYLGDLTSVKLINCLVSKTKNGNAENQL
jgi:hypothetical protein